MTNQSMDHGTTRVTFTYILLHSKYPVLVELLDCVRLQAGDISWLRYLPGPHRARRILGSPFMDLLTDEERLLAGSCLLHLARQGELPLVKVSPDRRYPVEYEYRVDVDNHEPQPD